MDDAERLLISLGISEARDIDLEVIAFLQGLTIQRRPLTSCEARLVALGDRGIITVRETSRPERQRFSVGHELGHWRYHRSKILMCQDADIGEEKDASKQRERAADKFASSLLMPEFIFAPKLQQQSRPTFELAMQLAKDFRVSVTAAVRRIVALDRFPSVLVSYTSRGRSWYQLAPRLGAEWAPVFDLDGRSRAIEVLVQRGRPNTIIRSNAGMHFSRPDASKYDVFEQCWSPKDGEVLCLFTVRQ